MYLSVAVSKINRWAVRESGDTLEMIERPHGGLSFVLADGQSSGRGAKAISAQVVRKIITDLAEGVRDGAAARAANDLLYAQRHGRVAAELVILSVELDSGLLIITRCGQTPVFVRLPGEEVEFLESESPALGFYRMARPVIDHVPLTPGLLVVACTDGLINAGSTHRQVWDVGEAIESLWQVDGSAQGIADGLMARALELDDERPRDDISVVALHVTSGPEVGPRRMIVEMPLPNR